MAYYRKNYRKKYSDKNKRCYYSGMGFYMGHYGRGINFKDGESRATFQKGYNAARIKAERNPLKYPPLPTKK